MTTTNETDAVKAMRPRDIADCVGHYMKKGDLDGIMTMFHPDCVLIFPKGAEPVTGLDAVREAFVDFVAIRPTLRSEVVDEVINGDVAMLTANWVVEAPDGSEFARGRSTEIAKRLEDGSWVYFVDHPYGRD